MISSNRIKEPAERDRVVDGQGISDESPTPGATSALLADDDEPNALPISTSITALAALPELRCLTRQRFLSMKVAAILRAIDIAFTCSFQFPRLSSKCLLASAANEIDRRLPHGVVPSNHHGRARSNMRRFVQVSSVLGSQASAGTESLSAYLGPDYTHGFRASLTCNDNCSRLHLHISARPTHRGPAVFQMTASRTCIGKCHRIIVTCAGTTGIAAHRLGRNYIGVELSPAYIALSKARLHDEAPMLAHDPSGLAQKAAAP